MCIAELNVSITDCQHRWYRMLRPCIPGSNLNSCPGKIVLEGWENRCDRCPFCSGHDVDSGELLLLGGGLHSRSNSISTPLSRTPSLSTTVSAARRHSQRESLARTGSTASIATTNYTGPAALGSPVFSAGERNRAINSRVDAYFEAQPGSIKDARTRRSTMNGGNLPRADENEEIFERRGSGSTSSSGTVRAYPAGRSVAKTWLKAARRRSGQVGALFR